MTNLDLEFIHKASRWCVFQQFKYFRMSTSQTPQLFDEIYFAARSEIICTLMRSGTHRECFKNGGRAAQQALLNELRSGMVGDFSSMKDCSISTLDGHDFACKSNHHDERVSDNQKRMGRTLAKRIVTNAKERGQWPPKKHYNASKTVPLVRTMVSIVFGESIEVACRENNIALAFPNGTEHRPTSSALVKMLRHHGVTL